MTLYQRGGYYERKTVDLFTAEGYHCWQARGSRGAADVIAIKPGQLVLIQVKSGTTEISGAEWNALWRLAALIDAEPVVAHWTPRRPVRLTRILAAHVAHKQTWHGRPFVLDEIDAALERHPAKGTTDA